jgi:hypothetical protein
MFNDIITAKLKGFDLTTEQKLRGEPIVYEMVSTKFTAWQYEEEVRVLADLTEKEGNYYFLHFQGSIKLAEVILVLTCVNNRYW